VIVFENLPEQSEVFVDGEKVTLQWPEGGSPAEFSIPPGRHGVEVKKDGYKAFGEQVSLSRGERAHITVKLEPSTSRKEPLATPASPKDTTAPAIAKPMPDSPVIATKEIGSAAPVPASQTPPAPVTQSDDSDEGFVPLFNGRDLTGWTIRTGDDTDWRVQDGAMRGYARNGISVIQHSAKAFRDFHLRLELKTANQINKNLVFRSSQVDGEDKHYRFHLGGLRVDNKIGRLGDYIIKVGGPILTTEYHTTEGLTQLNRPGIDELTPDAWHLVEIKAQGNTFRLFVDRNEVCTFRDDQSRLREGHIGVALIKGARLQIRKAEIKELSRQQIPEQPSVETSAWKPLFNGKDLTGWSVRDNGGTWAVEEGVLVGRSGPGLDSLATLRSDRTDFSNFRLRMKVLSTNESLLAVVIRHTATDGLGNGYVIAARRYNFDGAGEGSVFKGVNAKPKGKIDWAIKTQPASIAVGQWYTVEIEAIGNQITTSVDGKKVSAYLDDANSFSSGRISLVCAVNRTHQIQSIEIQEVP
jgi:hypothetical protein